MATMIAPEIATRSIESPQPTHGALWRYLVRSAICLFFVQGGATMFPIALSIPGLNYLINNPVALWVNMNRPLRMNGSTEMDLLLGLGGGLIWFLISRKTKYEDVLYHIARLEARYALGACMFGFGLIKLFNSEGGAPAQLWPPLTPDLDTPFGDISIGLLAWRYIGVAPTYHHFTGLVEAIGGLLLFNRRTTTLGAFINLASIINIAFLMGSAGLSLSGFWLPMRRIFLIAFLLYDDRERIIAFFLRDGRSVPPRMDFVWPKSWMRWTAVVLQIAFVITSIHLIDKRITRDWWTNRQRAQIEAVYDVSSFVANNDTLPDGRALDRWRSVAIAGCNGVARTVDDREVNFGIVADSSMTGPDVFCGETAQEKEAKGFNNYRLTARPPLLRYALSAGGDASLHGMIDSAGNTVKVDLRRVPDRSFALFNPGWFWVKGGPATRK